MRTWVSRSRPAVEFESLRDAGPDQGGVFQLRSVGIRRVILALVGAVAVADAILPGDYATGIVYVIPILMSMWLARVHLTWWLALGCIALTLGRLLLPLGDEVDFTRMWTNRAFVVFAIAVATSLGQLRSEVERELFESRELTATTLKSIGDAVIAVDGEGRVAFMNAVAETLTAWRLDDAVGLPLEQVFVLVSPAHDTARGDSGILRSPTRLRLRARDGREVPIERSAAPIRRAAGSESGTVLVFRDVTERQAYEETIRRMAYRDELTGLSNRNSFRDRLTLELAHARRNETMLALLFMDLDGFKEVNDDLGHHAGDLVLQEAARRLRGVLREGDTVARFGGDEFTVVLPDLHATEDAEKVADKILDAMRVAMKIESSEVCVTPSIGIALFPQQCSEAGALLKQADESMYEAKQRGGNRWVR